MPDCVSDAARVYAEAAGHGPPLVLLHGFAMHGGIFAPVLPALSDAYRVHAVDLPGHGRSARAAVGNLPSVASAVDAAIDARDRNLTVVGWSFGAQIALQWAFSHPARVARLVLVAPTPSFVRRDDWPHAMARETLARFGDELAVAYRLTLLRFLTLQVHGSADGRATLAGLRQRLFERGEPPPPALRATLDLLGEVDLRSLLPLVTAPALVVAGDRDTLVPIEATRLLAAALPDATHATIAGAAHAPFLSHGRAFVDVVRRFIDE